MCFFIYDNKTSRQALTKTSSLKAIPFKIFDHLRNTTLAAVIIKDKSGSTPLDILNSILIRLSKGVPHRATIIKDRPNKSKVSYCLSIFVTVGKITPK